MAAPTYQTTCTLQSFNWLAVTTGADTVVTCGMEDVAIKHTGLQADDVTSPTASVATDFIVVTDSLDSTTPTDDLDPGTAAATKSHKLILFPGDAYVFRGYDIAQPLPRKFNIRAVGHTAFVQLIRGSFGDQP